MPERVPVPASSPVMGRFWIVSPGQASGRVSLCSMDVSQFISPGISAWDILFAVLSVRDDRDGARITRVGRRGTVMMNT